MFTRTTIFMYQSIIEEMRYNPIHRRGKSGVARRRERSIARDQVPIEMNEMDEEMKNAQISSEDDQATTNHDFGSTSMGCTQEFTQASECPNFTSLPVPISIDIPDATNNLENLNTEMEDNELNDANNEVNGNYLKDESKGCDMTIQHDKLLKKEKRTIIAKLCETAVHGLSETVVGVLREGLEMV
ncbi:hypothetical protein FXO38_31761 [Capsicum annuum]|nr:hypothetical protein FXO38_31761 [Capsicum annuum]